jgi:hypothetical protein
MKQERIMVLVEPSVMLNSIMGKLYNVLTNGDDTVPMSEDNFFSWATPGIPIEPTDFEFLSQGLTGVVKKAKLDEIRGGAETEITPQMLDQLRSEDTSGLYMQAENFARLVDFVPDMATPTNDQLAKLSIMNNEGTLSERYEYILRMSQVMKSELPEETKQKIEKYEGLLSVTKMKKNLIDDTETPVIEPSPLVQVYNEKLKNYEDAALEYNSHRIDALTAANAKDVHFWAMNASILRNKVRAAMADWVTNGYKYEYEKISAFIEQVMQRDMSLLKAQYKDDLEKARISGKDSGSDFYYTSVVPGNFMRASGWTQFTFGAADYNNSSNSSYASSFSRKRAAGGLFGYFGAGGKKGNAHHESQSHLEFESENFYMSFWMTQVPIVRPWFKTSFLTSKLWRFDPTDPEAKGEMVNDGGKPPQGKIPAYPTSMLVIRDLQFIFTNSSGVSDFFSSYDSSSSGIGGFLCFGPLNLGAQSSSSSASGQTSNSFAYNSEKQTLTVSGAQLIGFKCHVLPKSPDPLSSITEWNG